MHHATVALLTEADYLAGEPYSPVRHEYVAGHIYAMAGASKAHNTIAGNLSRACGRTCAVRSAALTWPT